MRLVERHDYHNVQVKIKRIRLDIHILALWLYNLKKIPYDTTSLFYSI